jgi:hypothetical protein
MYVFRKLNTFLIFYLVILVSYAIIWVCFTLGFFSVSQNLPSGMWYVGGAIDFWNESSGEQVSKFHYLSEFLGDYTLATIMSVICDES